MIRERNRIIAVHSASCREERQREPAAFPTRIVSSKTTVLSSPSVIPTTMFGNSSNK
jgi:hypothetical protein